NLKCRASLLLFRLVRGLLNPHAEVFALLVHPLLEALLPRAEVFVELLLALLALARFEGAVIRVGAGAREQAVEVFAHGVGAWARAGRLLKLLYGGLKL